MHFFDASATRAALPFDHLIPALRDRFAAGCETPPRHVHEITNPADDITTDLVSRRITSLIMPAWIPGKTYGIKIVNIAPGNAKRGLTGLHGPSDMARSVMEGVAFALYDIFTVMREASIEASVVKASGGGARSALWRQMQADLFGCDVVTTQGAAEGAAFGAALVAGLGIGLYETPEQAAALCRPLTREAVDAASRARLSPGFAIYQALYPALRDNLHALSRAFDDIQA